MTSVVIDLAAIRERRAQAEGFSASRPPNRNCRDDFIQLQRRPDGSYAAKITGAYADDPSLAIAAMVDAAKRLSEDAPAEGIRLMADAISQLSWLATKPSATLT